MTELIRYEAARAALTAAASVDEVKDVLNLGKALAAYARMAKDDELVRKATDIRVRAEIRLGEMIFVQKETVGLAKGAAGIGKPASAVPEEYRTQPPTLAAAGIDKKLSVRAQGLARLSEPEREAHLAAVQKQASEALRMTTAEKQARRAEREAELGVKQMAWPTTIFGVLYGDPPWRNEPYSRDTGMDRAADNHYPTMTVDEIKARGVPSIAAKDSVLFLWATVPMLPQALEVMKAWGFEYKSCVTWAKGRLGTGYWFINQTEFLLVGTRGDIPAPAPGTQWPSLIGAPAREHSRKPEVFAEMIEKFFPTLPKIELFARGEARPGWAAWGNEAG
jgi:N6-adenosine-specific RNA methylase IME4